MRWVGLRILGRTGGSLLESTGTVEFSATYRVGGTVHSQHENSRFVKRERPVVLPRRRLITWLTTLRSCPDSSSSSRCSR